MHHAPQRRGLVKFPSIFRFSSRHEGGLLHALPKPKARKGSAGCTNERKHTATVICERRVAASTSAEVLNSARTSMAAGITSSPKDPRVPKLSTRGRGRSTSARPQLLCGYHQTLAVLLNELEQTVEGDTIVFSVYVLEPGESTARVLDAMRRAAERGVVLDLSVDCSLVSAFTSWCEGTSSMVGDMVALAEAFPATVSFKRQTVPTHAKYIVCHRPGGTSSAVFGGVNIGDRFASWKDFTIRVEGDAVVRALADSLSLTVATAPRPAVSAGSAGRPPPGVVAPKVTRRMLDHKVHAVAAACRPQRPSPPWSALRSPLVTRPPPPLREAVQFVTNRAESVSLLSMLLNRPFAGKYDLEPFLREFFLDAKFHKYTIAMAYMDSRGAALVQLALERGADVDLVMPLNPNVYQDCNRKALSRLLRASAGASGRLRAHIHSEMIHAKVILAQTSARSSHRGGTTAVVGSCNLKTRSFTQFTELNAVVCDVALNQVLLGEVAEVMRESREVHLEHFGRAGADGSMGLRTRGALLPFWNLRADVEEWLG
eukprot:CAMPEP_0118930266 /NCGR_PEP_ID=MMETSP1169-20130426/7005_1 /TAXON_ID=36882 /ORGANISM="Pyramimonas obovata, Strain CCMP722" /LENGTH=542 /DNA_ID=CAMNT_0006872593 /DNA_START=186 /DNA_END=1814 /DNA_ORIENTATION=-